MRMLRLVRFLLLSLVTVLLWTKVGATRAQYYQSCCTFSTLYDECDGCCSKDGNIDNAIFSCDGPGGDSIGYQQLDCGTAPPGGCADGASCGTSSVMVPQPDASCQACEYGQQNPCFSNLDCCGGMYCDGADPPAAGICQYD